MIQPDKNRQGVLNSPAHNRPALCSFSEVTQVQYTTFGKWDSPIFAGTKIATTAKILLSALAMAMLLATAGCGQKTSENQTTSSIGGGNAAPGKSKDINPAQTEYEQKHPKILLDTSLGSITLELNADKAPMTVANFLGYADAGLYRPNHLPSSL